MGPEYGGYRAPIRALRDDAATWRDISDIVESGRQHADGLALTDRELSWAGASSGLVGTYEEIRLKVSRLLLEGHRVLDALTVTLREVADAYESNEEAAVRRFKGIWSAVDATTAPGQQPRSVVR